MDGSIVSIYLENFVTYTKVHFFAGQNLNVIIGPNGTGKSTILCAIVLGLGGKAKLLGRMPSNGSYVQTSCESAKIEIELFISNGRNRKVTRIIHKDNRSHYMLDGVAATQKQVEELVDRLNIQIDNLLQFLPQDRVADFSKMNGQELLENTEKCIGSQEMMKLHELLKQMHKQFVENERDINVSSKKLAEEEHKNKRLAVDVDNIAEKKTLMELIKRLKQKRAWLVYDLSRKKMCEAIEDKKKANLNMERYEKAFEPMDRLINAAKTRARELEGRMSNMSSSINRKMAVINDQLDDLEKLENVINENIKNCERKIQDEEQRQNTIHSIAQQISKLENDLSNMNIEPENVIKAEINAIMKQLNDKAKTVNEVIFTREGHQNQLEALSNEIKANEEQQGRVKDVSAQRLNLLRRANKDSYEAVMWLRSNKHRFKGKIYEPMMLEINVPYKEFAKYVESIIARRDLFAFTFEDKSDMALFIKLVRDEMKLRVNALHSGPEHPPSSSFKPAFHMEQIRHYGFHRYLSDMVEGPETIMKYLCRLFKIHNIPVGNAHTFEVFEKVPEGISVFFSDTQTFFINKSKYSNKKSIRSSEVHQPYLLSITLNSQMLQELEQNHQSLQQQKLAKMKILETIQATIYKTESEMETLRNRKNELKVKIDTQQTVQSKLLRRKQELGKYEKMKIDPKKERELCKQKNRGLTVEMCEKVAVLTKLKKGYDEALQEYNTLQLELEVVQDERINRENESRDLLQKIEEARTLLRGIDEVIMGHRTETRRLFDVAAALTSGVSPKNKEFSAYMKTFHLLPDGEEELNKEIQDKQAMADCLGSADDGVMLEYETRTKTINDLKDTIEKKGFKSNELKGKMNSLRNEWLPPLKTLLAAINEKFGECFARLNCAGEIVLVTGDNEDDYSEYGLRIKVKFRDGDSLQVLTPHTQSGGERAVSTAIYLIALQEFIKVPFCCVDEINQGMDVINDRKIFQLLLASTNASGMQYFLLTPKLLSSFAYEHSTVLHCVYNGIGLRKKNAHPDISTYAQMKRRMKHGAP